MLIRQSRVYCLKATTSDHESMHIFRHNFRMKTYHRIKNEISQAFVRISCCLATIGSDNAMGPWHWMCAKPEMTWSSTGPRFTNTFSIAFQIRWKFRFTLISSLIEWWLQNFVHGMTAVLSWHVQKIVVIWWPPTELQQDEVSIEFELRAKKR